MMAAALQGFMTGLAYIVPIGSRISSSSTLAFVGLVDAR